MAPGTLVVLVCAMMAIVGPARALGGGPPPWFICANNKEAAELAARHMPLEPADGASLSASTPVAFSGESSHALAFSVASSLGLLSSPDIDSGLGSQSGSFYKFTSIQATATPRTIYWTASFTFTPGDCESASTFTTRVRTLIVAPTEAELVVTKRQQEEAAAKKKREEEAEAKKNEEEVVAAGSVLLHSVTIDVKYSREATVKLTCSDVARCVGELMLTASMKGRKRNGRHLKPESIGATGFSIAAGEQATVTVTLDKTGRVLLGAAHGHLSATLTIIRTSPLPSKTQIQRVRLDPRPAAKAKTSDQGGIR